MAIIYTMGNGTAYSLSNGEVLALDVSEGFIIDRTAEDVARWKMLHDKGWAAMTPEEQLEWTLGMKGAYKHTDMNRVESAVADLAARFERRGITLALTTKTDWVRTSWPTKNDMRRYFDNVEALRQATGVTLNAPSTPTINNRLTYQGANDIEKILLAVQRWLDSTDESEYYSGELYAGEV